MEASDLRELAINVSSDDIAVSRDATKRLQQLLTPEHVVAMLADPAGAAGLQGLLEEMEAVQNPDVFRLIGRVLEGVFTNPSDAARAVVLSPAAQFVIEFVVRSAAAADVAVAASMSAPLHRLVALARDADATAAALVGRCLDAHFHNEHVLRLFDCDAAESPTNAAMCAFLVAHTALLPFLFTATQGAFESDPLLLANYLVASGVACRTAAVPAALQERAMAALRDSDDALYFAFVCRFWGLALVRHEANGQRYAAACVAAVAPAAAEASQRDESTTEAIFDVLSAAASTAAGWTAVTSQLPCQTLQARLSSTSASLRLSTLNLMLCMLTSSHLDAASFFTKDLLLDAWQTRTCPDDDVRLALWRVVLACLPVESLCRVLGAACASFISSGAHEENVTVRSLKLQAADYLLQHATLPDSVKTRLAQVTQRGLYPAGSSGVSLMTKD